MNRSILFIDSYYSAVLHSLQLDLRPAAGADYAGDLHRLLEFGFGTGAAYRRNFQDLGWASEIVIPNSLTLQTQWSRERGMKDPVAKAWKYGAHMSRIPFAREHLHRVAHLHRIILEQAKAAKPDVIFVQDLNLIPPGLARALRKHTTLLVGEIASPLPPRPFLMSYDHILSALPSIVEKVTSWGIRAHSVPLAFDEKWAVRSRASDRKIDAIFVGSFSRLQPQTAPLLRAVADRVPGLRIYGPASEEILQQSGLAPNYVGQAWGRDMFELLAHSKLVINRHGAIAGDYAVNMRMFEATGTGAALVTENKSNLADFFEPGVEVVPYETAAAAAAAAAELLANPRRLDRIAAAGQRRTLEEHTYRHRSETVSAILEDALTALRR